MTKSIPTNGIATDELFERICKEIDFRTQLFLEPAKIDRLVRNEQDLQKLYERTCDLYESDRVAALKLMFHVFFQTPFGFGMHHVYDAIRLYMSDGMNEEVCDYIGRNWTRRFPELTEEDKAWWRRECAAWGCELTDR